MSKPLFEALKQLEETKDKLKEEEEEIEKEIRELNKRKIEIEDDIVALNNSISILEKRTEAKEKAEDKTGEQEGEEEAEQENVFSKIDRVTEEEEAGGIDGLIREREDSGIEVEEPDDITKDRGLYAIAKPGTIPKGMKVVAKTLGDGTKRIYRTDWKQLTEKTFYRVIHDRNLLQFTQKGHSSPPKQVLYDDAKKIYEKLVPGIRYYAPKLQELCIEEGVDINATYRTQLMRVFEDYTVDFGGKVHQDGRRLYFLKDEEDDYTISKQLSEEIKMDRELTEDMNAR